MKRNKILIPTLSALAVTPAIALVSCNQQSPEQAYLDAIFKPIDLPKTKLPKATLEEAYSSLSAQEQSDELVFDLFGFFNEDLDDETPTYTIRDLYLKNEGAFKVNVAVCTTRTENSKHYASFRGYISYVFAKQHTVKRSSQNIFTFEENDYIMVTYDFTDAIITPVADTHGYSYKINPQYGDSLGNMKYKFDGGKKDALFGLDSIDTWNDYEMEQCNSKNWVKE